MRPAGKILAIMLSALSVQAVFAEEEAAETGGTAKEAPVSPNLWTGRRAERAFEVGVTVTAAASTTYKPTLDLIKDLWGYLFDAENFSMNEIATDRAFEADIKLNTTPISLKIASASFSAFEIWTNLESRFYLNMSKNTITAVKELRENENNPENIKIDDMHGEVTLAGYAFFEIGLGASRPFLGDRLWLRIAPAVFSPLMYIRKNTITLSGYSSAKSGNGFMGLEGKGEITMYMPLSLDTMDGAQVLNSAGLDFSVDALFALLPILDMSARLRNIPLFPANLSYKSKAGIDINIKVPDLSDTSFWTPDKLLKYSNDISMSMNWTLDTSEYTNYYVMRPLRFECAALIKPFTSRLFIARPALGFSFNTIFEMFTFNYSMELALNLPVVFSLTLGTEYFELLFRHYAAAVFDFRVFEISAGLSSQGVNIGSSLSSRALGAFVSVKAGF
ncbi:MAG: hypothetical protein LBC77_01755 [Spirochaetaceae bacterium]|jgi:hypothetical protein|nr:hypothetical protein [Spirochaetaceae bacterium]